MTTTRQLARIAGIAEQTVRNYSRDYAELLSPAGRGDVGARLFSDDDVQIICTVATLRREDVPRADIIARLQRGDIVVEATPSPHQATPNAQAGQDAPQSLLLLRADVQRQIDALAYAQRTQASRALWSHGVAFWLGMVTMGAIFYFVWWLVNGW